MYGFVQFAALCVTAFAILPPFYSARVLAASHTTFARNRRAVNLSGGQITAFLDAHNVERAQHDAAPLAWSPALARKAAFWADLCMFKHSDGRLQTEPYGENIVVGTGDFPIEAAVGTFLSDKGKYDPGSPSYLYWTQVVWKSTTELGCAIASCRHVLEGPARETFYVCLYNPAGNVIGQAPQNVQV